MKWFQHHSTAHRNLKFQKLLERFGWKGYGWWWVLCEIIAEQGTNYRLKSEKNWKNYLKKTLRISEKNLNELLTILADSKLISQKALKNGDLWIPKMREYSDDYTKKVRRMSRQSTDNVRQDKIRLDNNILNNNKKK